MNCGGKKKCSLTCLDFLASRKFLISRPHKFHTFCRCCENPKRLDKEHLLIESDLLLVTGHAELKSSPFQAQVSVEMLETKLMSLCVKR